MNYNFNANNQRITGGFQGDAAGRDDSRVDRQQEWQ